MNFRAATEEDHPLLGQSFDVGGISVPSIADALVTDNEEGQRYWIVVCPYAFGQFRLQLWLERDRGEAYPAIFHEF